MKQRIKTLTVLILTCLVMYSGFYMATATAFPDNPGTYAYFLKICDMPYVPTPGPHPETFWQKGGDCDDRAIIFADYLKSKGAKNVQICWVCRMDENGVMVPIKNGDMGHSFVLWNGKVYSPYYHEGIYNEDIKTYQKKLKKQGFNMWYFENQTVGTPF